MPDQADERPETPQGRDLFVAEHVDWRLVAEQAEFDALLESLEAMHRRGALREIAIDFEFTMNPDPEKRRARLVQIGLGGPGHDEPERQYLVDLFSVDARGLQRLFGDATLTKVMHTPAGDYEQWLRYLGDAGDWEFAFRNVYDTSARLFLLAREQELAHEHPLLVQALATKGNHLSLSTAVEILLGFALSKRQQRAAWGAPQLAESALRYAALDVAVLPYLRAEVAALAEALRAHGVDTEARAVALAQDELAYAVELASIPVPRRKQLRSGLQRARWDARKRGGTHVVARDVVDVELRYLRRLYERERHADRLESTDGVVAVVV